MFTLRHQVLRKGERAPEGYIFVPIHMGFAVKHDGCHKTRYVMNGAHTNPPEHDVFSPVFGIDTFCLLLFISIHNNLDVCMDDATCAFL